MTSLAVNGTANGTRVNGHQCNSKTKSSNVDDKFTVCNGTTTSNVRRLGITVFSGGTAANSLVDVFNKIAEPRKRHLSYVIPISDNGGSSSELIRFVGGPSVGDIRSRLVRLIPVNQSDEMTALRTLFEHRLAAEATVARAEWLEIVENRSPLWDSISSPKRELIRSVLNTLNLEIVKRSRPSNAYRFSGASIGNMFLTGARLFSGSLESAIYLLSMVCSIPHWVDVLPAINSNHMHHISAVLEDETVLTGQMAISHPSGPSAVPEHDGEDDAPPPDSLPILRTQNIEFSKHEEEDLPARIKRLYYINLYGHEITARANPRVVSALENSDTVIYSIGSLYTSIMPSLILRDVGLALRQPHIKSKILILNATLDRETGPIRNPMTAVDFIKAIVRACEKHTVSGQGRREEAEDPERDAFRDDLARKYVTHLLYLSADSETSPMLDLPELSRLGVTCQCVDARMSDVEDGKLRYHEDALREVLESIIDA